MHTVVWSVNGATVPRAVRTRAREESTSGSVIQCACMAVVGKPTHLSDITFVKFLLVNNGFLLFLDSISLIMTKNVCEATELNNTHTRITTSNTFFHKVPWPNLF